MARTPDKIYTEKEWAEADPLDKLYMHLVEPERWALTYQQEDKLDQLRQVWAILCKKTTARARIKLISQHVDVTERTVHRIMNDAKHLFGDMLSVDVDLEYQLAYERLMKLHDKAAENKDYETARRCQDNALAVLERIEQRAPKKRKEYPTITFTSNPAALKARNEGEYIEHEQVGILELKAAELSTGD